MNKRRAILTGKLADKHSRCDESGKKIYRTRRKALRGNGKVLGDGMGSRDGNAYECRHCGFWHLTSRPS